MQDEFQTTSDIDRADSRFPDESVSSGDSAERSRAEVLYPNDAKPEDAPQEPAALTGAPPAYAFTPPEGMTLTPEIRSEIEPIFRELNLSDHGVAKLMPLAASMLDRNIKAIEADHAKQKADWAKTVKADPVIGGNNWGRTERNIAAALEAGKATPEFRRLLGQSGLGNHPEFIRVFNALGAQLGRAKPAKPADRGSARFPGT